MLWRTRKAEPKPGQIEEGIVMIVGAIAISIIVFIIAVFWANSKPGSNVPPEPVAAPEPIG